MAFHHSSDTHNQDTDSDTDSDTGSGTDSAQDSQVESNNSYCNWGN